MMTGAGWFFCFVTLMAQTSVGSMYHVAKDGSDTNNGSVEKPFLTIQRAANAAQPGDTVTVHEGVYRERVNPPRGGTSDEQRITYQAAPGEKVIITGAEAVTGWEKVQNETWKVTLPNRFFGDFNPFSDLIQGHWFDPKGRDHHTGAVYLDGHWLTEAALLDEVLLPAATEPLWFGQVDEQNTTIHAQFPGVDPNKELVEVNARQTVFYPDQPGRNYLTVRGFTLTQAATPWAPPTTEQIGLIGTHWSKGWIIEDNTISYSVCAGLTLGSKDMGEFAGTAPGYVAMIQYAMDKGGWSRENIGHHIVRGNKVIHCEAAGICGSLGGAFSLIENNEISHIWIRRQFGGEEQAGIKLHGPVDTVIRNNLVHHTGRFGIWLDWMGQGAEISGNVCFANLNDLHLEVNHGPALVANNIFLSGIALWNVSRGTAFTHNLFAGRCHLTDTHRTTPYLEPHSTRVAGHHGNAPGDDRFYNNLYVALPGATSFSYGPGTGYNDPDLPVTMRDNVYMGGEPHANDVSPMVFPNERPISRRVPLQKPDGLYIEWISQAEWTNATRQLVTSDLLGRARVPDAPYEHPDGSPIRVDRDYFGHPRNANNPMPGPFELPAGKVLLKIWPKN
jgi:alpha-L-arabinofuranosidase